MDTGDKQTGAPTTAGNKDSRGHLVKVEETLEDAVDTEPSETKLFVNKRRASYDFLRKAVQKAYCSVYTSEFQDTAVEDKD